MVLIDLNENLARILFCIGTIFGMCLIYIFFMLVLTIKEDKEKRIKYENSLTDKEYRKYKNMYN